MGAIDGSPFSVTLFPGPINGPSCYAFGNPTAPIPAYIPSTYEIQAVDQFGNNLTVGGATFSNDFTQTAFRIDLTGSSNSIPISNSPIFIEVMPGIANPNTSFAAGTGLRSAVAGEQANFTIYTRDLGNNTITVGGATFTFNMTLNSNNNVTVPVGYVDNGDGTYSCNYTAFVSGNYTLVMTMRSLTVHNSLLLLLDHFVLKMLLFLVQILMKLKQMNFLISTFKQLIVMEMLYQAHNIMMFLLKVLIVLLQTLLTLELVLPMLLTLLLNLEITPSQFKMKDVKLTEVHSFLLFLVKVLVVKLHQVHPLNEPI